MNSTGLSAQQQQAAADAPGRPRLCLAETVPSLWLATSVPGRDSPQSLHIAASVTAMQAPGCTAAAGRSRQRRHKRAAACCGPVHWLRSSEVAASPRPRHCKGRLAAGSQNTGLGCRRRRSCQACGSTEAAAPAQWRTKSFRITWQRSCAASQNVRPWVVQACVGLPCKSSRSHVFGSARLGLPDKHSSHGWRAKAATVLCCSSQHAVSSTVLLAAVTVSNRSVQPGPCPSPACYPAPDHPQLCCAAVEGALPAAPTPNSMHRSISMFTDARQRSQLGDGYG